MQFVCAIPLWIPPDLQLVRESHPHPVLFRIFLVCYGGWNSHFGLEAAFSKDAPSPALNIGVNPRRAPWADIIAFVRRSIIRRKGLGEDVLPIVPFGEWFALLEKKAENASEEDLMNIPGIKLLEFFRALARGDQAIRDAGMSATKTVGMTNFSTSQARQVSATMANMQAVGEVEAEALTYGVLDSEGRFLKQGRPSARNDITIIDAFRSAVLQGCSNSNPS